MSTKKNKIWEEVQFGIASAALIGLIAIGLAAASFWIEVTFR